MNVDAKKLHELYLYNVKPIAKDERFYEISNAQNYCISTYARVFFRIEKDKYRQLKTVYKNGEEAYKITFDGNNETTITISRLLANVFFPDVKIFRLYRMNNSVVMNRWNRWKDWKIENLHIIKSVEQMVEALQAKMEHRTANYSEDLKHHTFINRWIPPKNLSVPQALNRIYSAMRTRATNKKYKLLRPQYADTTISSEWLKDAPKFKQYWLNNQYYHPEKISLDKDIMGFGITNHYAEGLAIPIPVYINDIFVRNSSKLGYCINEQKRKNGESYYKVPSNAFMVDGKYEENIFCNTYEDALKAGRKRKAEYIRKIVEKERNIGYIPEHILETMSRWADLCEIGKIKIWEPETE